MKFSVARRAGVLTGAVFAVLWLVGTFLQSANLGASPFPRPGDRMDAVQRFFQESGPAVALNGALQVLAAVALLAFAGAMAAHLRRAGRDGAAPGLVLAAGSVSTATLMIGASVLVTLGDGEVTSNAPLTQALYLISFWLGGPLHVAALGLLVAAAATGLAEVLPRWLTASGLVIGGLGLAAALTGLVPAAAAFTLVGRFLGFAWLLVVTIRLAVRPIGVPEARTPTEAGA